MLWTPIVKLVADRFSGQARDRASFVLSITIIFGHFIAWAISGTLAAILNWRYSFLIPAFIMTAAGVFVFAALRREPVSGADAKAISAPPRADAAWEAHKPHGSCGTAALLRLQRLCARRCRHLGRRLFSLPAAAACLSSTLLSLIIPPLNILGIVLCPPLLPSAPRQCARRGRSTPACQRTHGLAAPVHLRTCRMRAASRAVLRLVLRHQPHDKHAHPHGV